MDTIDKVAGGVALLLVIAAGLVAGRISMVIDVNANAPKHPTVN